MELIEYQTCLIFNNSSHIKFLLSMVGEAFSHYMADVSHKSSLQVVWSEGLNYQHLVRGMSNGR